MTDRDDGKCQVTFRFQCTKTWHGLQSTDDPLVHFCDTCRRDVHFAPTVEDVERLAQEGKCVAFRSESVMLVGDVDFGRSFNAAYLNEAARRAEPQPDDGPATEDHNE
ncbi:MAG: hypothetical protein JST30_00410 [Armatimonadetes bacterium]|nr:hypothetical protein [Armatimonadota bacterium]